MKLVKDLQKWIEGYNELKTLADELELAFDFYKEELVTEEDVDAAYAKASEAVEAALCVRLVLLRFVWQIPFAIV